jgi:N6-adenosine-specific RNA methylase IME4
MTFPDKKYQIIYADPPWRYWEGGKKNQSKHYGTMNIEELKLLPVSAISDVNCALFLWVTFPILEHVFDLAKTWGFRYSTQAFTWVKRNKIADTWFWGCGGWTRANAELCLLFTKGSPKRVSRSVHSIIDCRIMEHSKKPTEVRHKIVELMGDLPRIELFARQKADGWDAWGNEVDKGV